MNKITHALALLLAATQVQAFDLGIAPRFGSQGVGLDLVSSISDKLNLRLGGYTYSYQKEFNTSDANYDGQLKLKTAGLMADYHVFSGHLRLSVGGFYNGNRVDVTAKPGSQGYYFGNSEFTTDRVKGSGTLTFKKFAPYVGIGGGNAVAAGSNWSFLWDLGALYQNKGTVKLNAQLLDQSVLNTSEGQQIWTDFQAEIQKQQADLQNDVNGYKWYPVLSMGVSYKF